MSVSDRTVSSLALVLVLILFCTGSSYSQLRRRYHGIDLDLPQKRCSMELMGVEVSDVLRAFADQYKLNMVIDSGVSGKIDLVLNNVPIKEAFLTILRSARLAYIKEGKIFRIMSLEKLTEENKLRESSLEMETQVFRPRYASAFRLSESMKNLLSKRDGSFIDADDRTNSIVVKDTLQKLDEMKKLFKLLDVEKVTDVRPVSTEIIELKFIDTKETWKNVSSLLSDVGKVEVNEKTNSLIVSDIPETIAQIKTLIQKLDKPSRQVHIEAKIVETTKNFIKALGIQWGGYYTDGPPSGKNFPKVALSGVATGGSLTPTEETFAVNLPMLNVPSYGGIGLSLGHLTNKVLLDIQLNTMEEKGEGRILSTPKIVTLDNTKAIIETGARVPYQTVEIDTAKEKTVNIEYVEALTRLEVTPHITSDNRIKMKILADKDRPDFSKTVGGNPLISRKGAMTELIVKDGEATVIGGLSVSDTSESKGSVPWFADLPLIGKLFKNSFKTKSYDELLIFITPHIIENQ